MKSVFQALVVAAVLTACGCGAKNSRKVNTDPQNSTSPKVIAAAESDTIAITFKNGYGKITVSKKERQVVYLSFDSGDSRHLYGKLTSLDSTSNIRFIQIVMPDGTMDGPFWNEISYDLPLKGSYTISVGENMMAGDPWAGTFTVEVTLTS